MSDNQSNTLSNCLEVWVDTETRYVLRIYKNTHQWDNTSHLCGYVELPKGHNCEGANTMQLQHLHVHGGVTYSQLDIPSEPHFKKSWWVGFDCNHYIDTNYPKTHEFVRVELIGLAKQLFNTQRSIDANKVTLVMDWLNENTE